MMHVRFSVNVKSARFNCDKNTTMIMGRPVQVLIWREKEHMQSSIAKKVTCTIFWEVFMVGLTHLHEKKRNFHPPPQKKENHNFWSTSGHHARAWNGRYWIVLPVLGVSCAAGARADLHRTYQQGVAVLQGEGQHLALVQGLLIVCGVFFWNFGQRSVASEHP